MPQTLTLPAATVRRPIRSVTIEIRGPGGEAPKFARLSQSAADDLFCRGRLRLDPETLRYFSEGRSPLTQ